MSGDEESAPAPTQDQDDDEPGEAVAQKRTAALEDRVTGAFLGAAVADALAFPYRDYSASYLRSLAQPLTAAFAEPTIPGGVPGQVTDDTQEALAVAAAIVELGRVEGKVVASHMIPLWRDHLLIARDEATARAMDLLVRGEADWNAAGLAPGHAEIAPVSRSLPVALLAHDSTLALNDGVVTVTRITHTDPRVLAAAAAFAAGVAYNLGAEDLILGEFLDRTAVAAERHCGDLAEALLDFPRLLSLSETRALRRLGSLLPDDRYPLPEDGLGAYAVPGVLVAVYYFLRSPYDFERAVESVLRAGLDQGTPSFLAGALSGALVGEQKLPGSLCEQLPAALEIRTAARALAALKQGEGPR